jgi:hypothetical protein
VGDGENGIEWKALLSFILILKDAAALGRPAGRGLLCNSRGIAGILF